MTNPYFEFIDKLAATVKKRRGKMSKRLFAKQVGVSNATISRLEKGYPIDLESFFKILFAFNVDFDEMLKLKPREPMTYGDVWTKFDESKYRLKVPQGWLIDDMLTKSGPIFMPDPEHDWILQ